MIPGPDPAIKKPLGRAVFCCPVRGGKVVSQWLKMEGEAGARTEAVGGFGQQQLVVPLGEDAQPRGELYLEAEPFRTGLQRGLKPP